MFEKRSTNICWAYILPLVNLDKWSFGHDNFVNCYVSSEGKYVVVESKAPFTTIGIRNNKFRFDFTKKGLFVGVFEVPEEFIDDIQRFREGRFSEFSSLAKAAIKKKYSSLYKQPIANGKYESQVEFLALDKDKELRAAIEKFFETKLPADAELMSIPGEECFYKLDVVTKLEDVPTC